MTRKHIEVPTTCIHLYEFNRILEAARAMKAAIDGALYGLIPWDELRPVLKAARKQAEEAGI